MLPKIFHGLNRFRDRAVYLSMNAAASSIEGALVRVCTVTYPPTCRPTDAPTSEVVELVSGEATRRPGTAVVESGSISVYLLIAAMPLAKVLEVVS